MFAPNTRADLLQRAVFDFLSDPVAQGGEVRRCDTHAAAVFLVGDRALKVKRSVHFPFLDYSTLEKRKTACTAELEVNRRFAPQLYRRVVPITREPGGRLALTGKGEPVEWVVEMVRFDEDQTLDRLADRGVLPEDVPAKLAAMVLAIEDAAQPADANSWISALDGYIAQNSSAFLEEQSIFPKEDVCDLEQRSRDALKSLRPLLLRRAELGYVRRGHGDLHLGNIALIDETPVALTPSSSTRS